VRCSNAGIKQQGKKQICVTDPDSKSMKNNGEFEVCFNMQPAVDSKHKLFIDFEVVNDVNEFLPQNSEKYIFGFGS